MFEPEDDSRTSITGEELLRLTTRLFAGDKHADVLACLERPVVFLFGHKAVYLRLPSQDPAAKVHRIKVDRKFAGREGQASALWNMAQTGKKRWPKRCA